MRRIFICLLIVFGVFNTTAFSREKIKEDTNGIAYSYSDWKEFYEIIISFAQKGVYKHAYLLNGNEEKLFDDTDFPKADGWQLYSAKILSEGEMTAIFVVLSPNNHTTILMFSSGYEYALSKYKIATKNENYLQVFLYKVESAFDEQICFFDEDVPLKLMDFNEVKKPPKNWSN